MSRHVIRSRDLDYPSCNTGPRLGSQLPPSPRLALEQPPPCSSQCHYLQINHLPRSRWQVALECKASSGNQPQSLQGIYWPTLGLLEFSIQEESSSERHVLLDAIRAQPLKCSFSFDPSHRYWVVCSDNREQLPGLQCLDFRSRQRPEGNERLGQRGEDLDGFGPNRKCSKLCASPMDPDKDPM